MRVIEQDVIYAAIEVEQKIMELISELEFTELIKVAETFLDEYDTTLIDLKEVLSNWDGDF